MIRLLIASFVHLISSGPDTLIHQFVGIGNQKIHYVTVGQPISGRPTLLMIHGSPGDAMAFKAILNDTVLQQKVNLVSVDRPGYGKSLPREPERDMRQQALRIGQILEKLPQPVIVMGHSYGGPVAVQMALDFQSKLCGVVVVAGSVDPDLEETKFIQRIGHLPGMKFILPTDLYVCNEEILALPLYLTNMRQRLTELHIPTVVVQGLKDNLVPPGNATFLEKHLKYAPLKVHRYTQLNHFIPFLQPHLVRKAVLEVLEMIASNKQTN